MQQVPMVRAERGDSQRSAAPVASQIARRVRRARASSFRSLGPREKWVRALGMPSASCSSASSRKLSSAGRHSPFMPTLALHADAGDVAVARQRAGQAATAQVRRGGGAGRPGDRQHAEALQQVAARELVTRAADVILRDQGRWISLVRAHVGLEPAPYLDRDVSHGVAPHGAVRVAEPRVEQQAGRFDGAGAQEHGAAGMAMVLPVRAAVDHRSQRTPVGADGGAMPDGVGRKVRSMLPLAPVRQPWWQCPQLMQAPRCMPPGSVHACDSLAAGASVARMPSSSHAAAITVAAALQRTGGKA